MLPLSLQRATTSTPASSDAGSGVAFQGLPSLHLAFSAPPSSLTFSYFSSLGISAPLPSLCGLAPQPSHALAGTLVHPPLGLLTLSIELVFTSVPSVQPDRVSASHLALRLALDCFAAVHLRGSALLAFCSADR